MATRKVAIVDEAHCLNEHGQNALLKTLEEPPGRSVLILVSSSAALLLRPVRSRCQLVRLDPLPRRPVARVLVARGVPAERAVPLAALADGSPGRALAMEGEPETRARERVLEALPRLRELDAKALSDLAQELSRGPARRGAGDGGRLVSRRARHRARREPSAAESGRRAGDPRRRGAALATRGPSPTRSGV
jgi:DNA polymerase-3 subunit delta'